MVITCPGISAGYSMKYFLSVLHVAISTITAG